MGNTSLVPDSLSQVGEESLVQSQLWAKGDTEDSLVLIEGCQEVLEELLNDPLLHT